MSWHFCRTARLGPKTHTEARTRQCRRRLQMLQELGLAHDLDSSAFGAQADVPEAKADLVHAVYGKVVVAGRDFVSARLTRTAYSSGLALALPQVVMARPEGSKRTPPTFVIEGLDELVQALLAA